MDNTAVTLFFVIYSIWALYSGWKWVSGRFAFLEKDGIQYKVLKVISAYFVGGIIGVFYLLHLIFKFICRW